MTETPRVRPAGESDLPMLLAWRNHPGVRLFMLTQHEIAMEEHSAWFAKASQDPTRRLLIVEEANQSLGYVQFANVATGAISDWGFYARPDPPKGSGRKIGTAALNHAFDVLQLHKVCGQAIASNEASIALHTKLGFVQEGVLRDQQRIEDAYHSLFCFGLLNHEWRAGKEGFRRA